MGGTGDGRGTVSRGVEGVGAPVPGTEKEWCHVTLLDRRTNRQIDSEMITGLCYKGKWTQGSGSETTTET